MANIDSKYDSFIHFTVKFNSRDYSISFFSGIFNSKNYSITFFPRKFNSKFDSKIKIWLYSIQQNIHSIRKPGYRTPLHLMLRPFQYQTQHFRSVEDIQSQQNIRTQKSLQSNTHLGHIWTGIHQAINLTVPFGWQS